jgi:hypothetical protein
MSEMIAPKSLQDLPHFVVSSIERGERHPGTEQIEFKVHGIFDQASGVREGRCWLLLPDKDWLVGDLTSLDLKAGTAIFLIYEEPAPDLIGKKLPYVDGCWQAYHVWMVADPSWHWSRVRLERRQVVSEVFQARESQTIDRQEVKTWIRVKESPEDGGKERLYPVLDGVPHKRLKEILAEGWDHEHCELCRASIHVGGYGFSDLREHWVCEACHAKYVVTHDLSFLYS